MTSHARVELHKQLVKYADGYGSVYCDTDSCFSLTDRNEEDGTGDGLGEWKEEGTFSDFESLAPKTYWYQRPLPDGYQGPRQLVAKAKGIEDPDRNWYRLRAGEGIASTRGVMGLKSALRGADEFFVRKDLTRRLLGTEDENGVRWYGDRWLGPDGCTHPTTMEGLS